MAGRVTLVPIPLNNSALTPGIWPPSGSVGYDTGSPGGSFTAWSSNNGIQFVNNGQIIVAWVNGATAANAQVLVGQKVAGTVLPNTTFAVALTTSSSGWLGPFSPATYNQQDSSQFSGSLAGAIGTSGVGMTCIDFSSTTTVAVRLYQLIPVSP